MTASAMIGPKFYGWDKDGLPLAFGLLYTYEVGTEIDKATYTTEDASVENSNPVVLNSEGWADVKLVGTYSMLLTDSLGGEIWSDPSATDAASQVDQWVQQKDAVYVSPTEFKVTGEFTDLYVAGRSIQANDATQLEGFIVDSTFTAGETFVTVEEMTLTPALTWVRVGIFTAASFPQGVSGLTFVASVSIMSTLDPDQNDSQLSVKSYLPGEDTDGGLFYYDTTRAKTDHDGILVISNTVPWNADLAIFQSGSEETDPLGDGVYVKIQTWSEDGVVAGHTKAGNTQIWNGRSGPNAFDFGTEIAVDTWATVGKTGSGADETWPAMNVLPANAVALIVDVDILAAAALASAGIIQMWVSDGDDPSPDTSDANLIGQTWTDHNSAGGLSSGFSRAVIPLGATNQDFNAQWSESDTTAPRNTQLYYRGFMTD